MGNVSGASKHKAETKRTEDTIQVNRDRTLDVQSTEGHIGVVSSTGSGLAHVASCVIPASFCTRGQLGVELGSLILGQRRGQRRIVGSEVICTESTSSGTMNMKKNMATHL